MSGNRVPPFEAYRGEEPFVFVSYAHVDMAEVYEDLTELHRVGYRIWYDEGIEPGQQFAGVIQDSIKKSAFCIAFLSPAAVESNWVRSEVSFSLNAQKQFLAVHLKETELRHGLGVLLETRLALRKHELPREEYLRRLKHALPSMLIEEPPVPSAESNFAHEIERIFTAGGDYSENRLLELGDLLGLDQGTVERVIREKFQRLGISPDSREREGSFRKLVQFLVAQGPLQPSRQTLADRAKEVCIPPGRWEVIVQEEALGQARELAENGHLREARDLLISSVGKVVGQSSAVREFLEDLQGRMVPAPARVSKPPPPVDAMPGARETALPLTQPPPSRAVTRLGEMPEIVWVRIPAGMFIRGCPKEFKEYIRREYQPGRDVLDTYPERKEPLDEFWISLAPITNAQFYAFVRETAHRYPAGWRGTRPPYPPDAAEKPVTGVTWHDSAGFAQWLEARLPSRAEYEKACRGEHGLVFPWGDHFDKDKCNTAESERGELMPVGAIPENASRYGVLDLVGNVWQWTAEEGERGSRMTVGASYEWTGEIYGAGFFDMSRPPESSDKDLGFRLATSDVRQLRIETKEY